MDGRIYCTLVLLSSVFTHSQVFSQLEEQSARDKASKKLMTLISEEFQGTDLFDTSPQYIFPYMNFTCEGIITKVTIGVGKDPRSRRQQVPDLQVQIWRNGVNDTLSVVASSTVAFDNTNSWQVYELVPNPPPAVQQGDMLGYLQPEGRRQLLGERTATQRPLYQLMDQATTTVPLGDLTVAQSLLLPLIAIEIESTASECSNGFIEEERLRLIAGLNTLQQETQALFPLMAFKYNGTITHAEIALECCSNNTQPENSPQLQIWRESVNIPNTYSKLASVNVSVSGPTNTHFLVSNFSVNPPLKFQENDFVGLYVPTASLTKPYYYHEPNITGAGYTVRSSESVETFISDSMDIDTLENALPLISFEIDIHNGTTDTTPASGAYGTTAIAAIVAILVLLFIIALVIVVLAKSWQIRNRQRDQNRPTIQFVNEETDSNAVETDSRAIETEDNVAYNTTHLQHIVLDDDTDSSDGEYTHVTPAKTDLSPSSPESYLHPYHVPHEPARTLSSLALVGNEECDDREGEPMYDRPVAALSGDAHVYAEPTRREHAYLNTGTVHDYENATSVVQGAKPHTYCNTLV